MTRKYLLERQVSTEIWWPEDGEPPADKIADFIEGLPEVQRQSIESDFQAIQDMSTPGGVLAIIDAGRDPMNDIDLADGVNTHGSRRGFVFWVFLSYPPIFAVAQYIERADSFTFQTRDDLPEAWTEPCEQNALRLGQLLSEHYSTVQGRGQDCKVDFYPRRGRYFFFCSLSDHPITHLTFEDHEPKPLVQTLAFELIFIYDPKQRTLHTKVQGDRTVREEVEKRFGMAVIGGPLGPAPRNGSYELQHLLRPYCFSVHPQDDIACVRVRSLRFRIGMRHKWFGLDVGADAPENAIWELLNEVLQGSSIKLHTLSVVRAEIAIVYKATGARGRQQTNRFSVSPRSTSLKWNPRDEKLHEYLTRWNINAQRADSDDC